MSLAYLLTENELNNYFSNLEINYLEKNIIKYITRNYTNKYSPAEKYYKLRGKRKEFLNISFNEKYDYLTTLSWGLPVDNITLNELSDNKKIISKIKKI